MHNPIDHIPQRNRGKMNRTTRMRNKMRDLYSEVERLQAENAMLRQRLAFHKIQAE